ncbi:MAG: hypothetical protein R2852_00460 [Bacteroidia bacterium]
MQKYLILVLTLLFSNHIAAQEELDTNGQKDNIHLDDLIWIKDSTYGILKSLKFKNLKTLYPSFRTYKNYIDTSYAGSQSDVTKFAMYNNFWNNLRLQYYKIHKKTRKAGIDWAKTTLDSFSLDTGGIGSHEYVYLHLIIKHKERKRYILSALFLKMEDKWFLMDELKYEGILVDKKKRKKRKKR